ncbi:FmdB family zinc ribbon protein [Gordonia phthalatica]|uniref:FmdB family zinc ribbon protein n=1 Tax=Gordonia phthalatica TaxID=1136941 RepID=UPI0009EC3D0F|nr:FmdB family zinc ribbon protein [Gordonia phthalatica]
MPVYQFLCADCGRFEARFSMAEVPDSTTCRCGASARRGVSSPAFGRGGRAMALMDATKSTAERPAVVDRVPAGNRRGTPTSTNPLHAKLPRP